MENQNQDPVYRKLRLAALEAAKAEKPEYSEAYDAALQAISMTNAVNPDAIEDRIFSTSFSEDGDELGQCVRTPMMRKEWLWDSIRKALRC